MTLLSKFELLLEIKRFRLVLNLMEIAKSYGHLVRDTTMCQTVSLKHHGIMIFPIIEITIVYAFQSRLLQYTKNQMGNGYIGEVKSLLWYQNLDLKPC